MYLCQWSKRTMVNAIDNLHNRLQTFGSGQKEQNLLLQLERGPKIFAAILAQKW